MLVLLATWLVNIILIFLSVAFFTLFERKVMGLFHIRVGPNKVSFFGLLQPLLDAFKLLMKQDIVPLSGSKWVYTLSPILGLSFSVLIWSVLPVTYYSFSISFSWVVFYLLGSLLVFPVLLSGWSSNSKYSLIGSLRSVAQSISYEVVFSVLLITVLTLSISYSINSVLSLSSFVWSLLFPVWIICTLAETHRAPFDFSESESELVSGFNTEYSGVGFAMFFLSEYSVLLMNCFLLSYLFMNCFLLSYSITLSMSLMFSFIFIWIRITYCRFRYDLLMMLSWKVLLPFCLSLFICLLTILL